MDIDIMTHKERCKSSLTYATGGYFSRLVSSESGYGWNSWDFQTLDAPQLIPCGSAHKYAQYGTFHERESNG